MKDIRKYLTREIKESKIDVSDYIDMEEGDSTYDKFIMHAYSKDTVGIMVLYNIEDDYTDYATFVPLKELASYDIKLIPTMSHKDAADAVDDNINAIYDYIQDNVGMFEQMPNWTFVELK